MIHTLERSQFLKAEPGKVWEYFSNPRNLNELTPPDMQFEILGNPGPMYAGQMIAYRIRIAPGIRLRWLTEIRQVSAVSFFADEQRIGPYRLWYHEHHFAAREGGVEMLDRVTYALGFGPLGELAHIFWVKRQLLNIFEYRRRRVAEVFG